MSGSGPSGGPEPAAEPAPSTVEDGWSRLHPATPLLRGGVVLLAVLVWVVVQLRDVWITLLLGDLVGEAGGPEDPATRWILGNTGLALGGLALLLAAILVGGWLSWRMHTYRIGDDIVEEREGLIWRKHRRARLDRIQGVNVERPVLARIFGAARLEIAVAGEDANIKLSYLRSATANALRAELLAAASRARAADLLDAAPAEEVAASSVLAQRLQDFTAPELDAALRAPDSIVRMDLGRLLGSTALSTVIPVVVLVAGAVVPIALGRQWVVLFAVVPIAIAIAAFAIRRVTRSLRYSIALTPDGIRVGFGLFSTTNETLPPGRIHAIEVLQPLVWRPFGWWSVRINRASRSTREGAAGQAATTILPVGNAGDVAKVLGLILPGLDVEAAQYVTSPHRAQVFRWFSWRRNGFAITEDAVLLRKGAIWRTLTIVPLARVQSIAITSGPIARAARLRSVGVHTVAGMVTPAIGALDESDAAQLWRDVEARTLEAIEASR